MPYLGKRVKDKVTGYEGIAVERIETMGGFVSFTIQATELDQDGDPRSVYSIEVSRLELVTDDDNKRIGFSTEEHDTTGLD